MFAWLKRTSTRPATALAMIGPRAADAVLFQGASEPAIAGETGTVTRLNGRTVIVGEAGAEAVATRAAEQAGALIEFIAAPLDALPFDSGTFHIVVTPGVSHWPAERRGRRLAEAVRVLQPGGRLILIEGGPDRGWLGRLSRPPVLEAGTLTGLLLEAGLVAARRLAEADGGTYYEARKAR